MKVSELIEKLKEAPQDYEVMLSTGPDESHDQKAYDVEVDGKNKKVVWVVA